MQALEKAGSSLRLTKLLHLERDLDLSLDLERGDLERYRSRDLDLERRGDRDLDLSLCTCDEKVKNVFGMPCTQCLQRLYEQETRLEITYHR